MLERKWHPYRYQLENIFAIDRDYLGYVDYDCGYIPAATWVIEKARDKCPKNKHEL